MKTLSGNFKKALDGLTHPEDGKPLNDKRPNNVVIKRSNPTKNGDYKSYSATYSWNYGNERREWTYERKGNQFVKKLKNLDDFTYDYQGGNKALENADSFATLEEGFNKIAEHINMPKTGRVVLYTDDGINQPDRAEFDMSDLSQRKELLTRMGLITKNDAQILSKRQVADEEISKIIGRKTTISQESEIENLAKYGTQQITPSKN